MKITAKRWRALMTGGLLDLRAQRDRAAARHEKAAHQVLEMLKGTNGKRDKKDLRPLLGQ